jgi:type 1 glutamine amidotransferase
MIQGPWRIADEIYHFREGTFSRDRVHVLLSIDPSAMDEAARAHHRVEKGKDYPLAWTNAEGKGRIFYTALGHGENVWTNSTFQQHLMGGIAWALRADDPPTSTSGSNPLPPR